MKLWVILLLCLVPLAHGQYVITVPLQAIAPAGAASVKQNVPFNGPLNIKGGVPNLGSYTCTITSGSLPTGLSLTGCSIIGTATGTTPASAVISVADSLGQSVSLTIGITPVSLSSVAVTSAVSNVAPSSTLQMVCTGTWSDSTTDDLTQLGTWLSGTPAKATIDAFGLVTGVAAGTTLISCTFHSVSGSTTITVPATNPAVATSSPLPNAQQTIAYLPFVLTGTGGTSPYTWAITVGSLPTGLTLTSGAGVISGTPTGTTQTFTVQLTDALAATATKSLTLTVATVSSNAVVCSPGTITAGSSSQCTSTTTFSDASTANTSIGSGLVLVNTAAISTATGGTVSSLQTPAFNAVTGNLLYVGSRHGTDFASAITVTDTAGNTFTAIGSLTANSPNLGAAQQFYAKNITGNAADRVTCTYASPVAFDDCVVIQISGADTSAPLDQHSEVANTTASNSCISGSITTTLANEAMASYCTAASLNAVFSPGAGYAVNVTDADGLGAIQSKFVSAIQTAVTANMSFNGTAKPTIGLTATFKAAASMGAAWSSGTTNVATVNGSGLVSGSTAGSSVISAIYGGQTGTATVTVTGGAVTSVTITPSSVSGTQNSTQAFVARDQSSNDITGSVVWASQTPSCVTMNGAIGTVVSATSCSSTITATSGSVFGSGTFFGTGTAQNQGLLSGCHVNSNNTIAFGSSGCPAAIPAGWTQVQAVAFEDGTPGTGANFNAVSISCSFAHTGSCSATHKVIKGDDTGQWNSQSWTGTKDTYISWWEWEDAGGSVGTDLGLAGVAWPTRPNGASFWIDPNSPAGCNGSQYPNNVQLDRYMLIFGEGALAGSQAFGYLTGCIPLNKPSWGNWTQWEYRIKINDPVAYPSAGNGEYQLYQNGTLVVNMPSGAGPCSSGYGNGSGTLYPCSNLVGTVDYTLYPHNAWIGGVSTYRFNYTSSAHTTCSTALDFSDAPQSGQVLAGLFTTANPCPLQAAPNGWPMNSVSGGLNRYWDDIIIMRR